MILRDINDIFEVAPPITFGKIANRALPAEEMLYFRLRGISPEETDQMELATAEDALKYDRAKCTEEHQKRVKAKIREKLVSIHNYHIRTSDGGTREVTDFDEFYRVAPRELRDWLFAVANSGEMLSAAERLNFLAPPASPSLSH